MRTIGASQRAYSSFTRRWLPPRDACHRAAAASAQAVGASVAAGAFAASGVALASDNVLHPPAYPWTFNGFFNAYDAASIRRGHQVYTQICATCHSLNRCGREAAEPRGRAARSSPLAIGSARHAWVMREDGSSGVSCRATAWPAAGSCAQA